MKINKISLENAHFEEGKLSGLLKTENETEWQLFEGRRLLHVQPQLSKQEIRRVVAAVELAYKAASKHSQAIKSTPLPTKNWLKSFLITRPPSPRPPVPWTPPLLL